MTNIEWTQRPGTKGETWNPVVGCRHVAEGCRNCYAETMSKRLAAMGQTDYAAILDDKGKFNGKAITRPETLDKPLRWRKPRTVFVNSMSDLFHEDVPFEFIAAVYGVMAACTQHTFIVLTKRPERMLEYFGWLSPAVDGVRSSAARICAKYAVGSIDGNDYLERFREAGHREWPLPNVWHGTSIANQKDADRNIPIILQVPSAVRFISAEPLVSEVYLQQNWLRSTTNLHSMLDIAGALQNRHFQGFMEDGKPMPEAAVKAELERRLAAGEKYFPMGACDGFSTETGCPGHRNPALDWIIVGGESGPGARPCDIAWIRSIIQQCKAAGVPVFNKQLGAAPWADDESAAALCSQWRRGGLIARYVTCDGLNRYALKLQNLKGGDPSEWPEDLRVREYPAVK